MFPIFEAVALHQIEYFYDYIAPLSSDSCCNPCCRVITYHCQGQAAEIYVEHNIPLYFLLDCPDKRRKQDMCKAQHNISCSRPLSTYLFEVRESTSF